MRPLILIVVGLSLLVTGCQASVPTLTPELETSESDVRDTPGPTPTEPFAFNTSEPGFVTLHGSLAVLDPITMIPAPDDAIFLVPMDLDAPGVSTIPQFQDGEVPQAQVDERTGEFVFQNIQPGRYAVVVVTKGGAQIPARKMEEGNLAIITIEESDQDQVVELGVLSFP